MLLLNPGRVADGLRSGDLSEHAQARLLVWSTFLSLFWSRASLLSYRTRGQMLAALVLYGLFLAGVWSCYRLNARLDNCRFVERYVCLSIPLWVWLVLTYAVLYYAAFYLLRGRLALDAATYPERVRPFVLLYGIVAVPVYFVLLRRYLRRAAADVPAS